MNCENLNLHRLKKLYNRLNEFLLSLMKKTKVFTTAKLMTFIDIAKF
jgi:hypothetical protein